MKEKLIRIAPILLIIAIAILSIITVVTVVNAFMNGGNNKLEMILRKKRISRLKIY